MRLDSLKLRNYRNLVEVDVAWGEQFNVIHGQNAQGKTNLLEAIYLLGHLKSFRGVRGHELICHGADTAWVGAAIRCRGVEHRLEIGLQQAGRTPKIDGKTVTRLSQFFGHLRTVLFTPEELGAVRGFPAGRRALLDRAILQTDPVYLERVQEYERIIRQRNQLLKQTADEAQLEPWTASLIKVGSRIRQDRLAYLERLRPKLATAYREITAGGETAGLDYTVANADAAELAETLAAALQRLAGRERKLGMTLGGPHRDDLELTVDGRSLRTFGSQGQQRSYLLAFKAAQVIDLEERLHEAPVLLLDDLASELDYRRQEGFFHFLLQRQGQVFLTSAQQSMMTDAVRNKASYFKVERGVVCAVAPTRG